VLLFGHHTHICIIEDANETMPITLRACDINSRTLWTRQLQTTIDYAKANTLTDTNMQLSGSGARKIGRLLIELVCVRQLYVAAELGAAGILCRLQMNTQTQVSCVGGTMQHRFV
jgi:hypothetical protein